MATTGEIKVLDSILGSSFLASQAAMGVFQRHRPDIAQGSIEVLREGDSDFVVYTDRHRQLGVRAGTAVELDTRDLKTLLSNTNRIKVDTIQGSSFLAIGAAMEIFRRYEPDLVKYRIEVVRDGDSLVVIFTDKDRLPGTRGSIGLPGFEVAFDARDRRVLRSNFIR
jgi:hypothetical protein